MVAFLEINMSRYTVGKETEGAFWKRVDRLGPSECWLWRGMVMTSYGERKYGVLKVRGERFYAHKLSWELKNKDGFSGQLRRSCGNTLCVNPWHMYLISTEDGDVRKFWENVDKCGEGDCWKWTGGRYNQNGYGCICVRVKGESRTVGAHVFSWKLKNGRFPKRGLVVMHTCDNPECVNPKHLVEGRYVDNTRDMMRKRRHRVPCGEAHCKTKITERDVVEIRRLYHEKSHTQKQLGIMFGMSRGGISNIVNFYTWRI